MKTTRGPAKRDRERKAPHNESFHNLHRNHGRVLRVDYENLIFFLFAFGCVFLTCKFQLLGKLFFRCSPNCHEIQFSSLNYSVLFIFIFSRQSIAGASARERRALTDRSVFLRRNVYKQKLMSKVHESFCMRKLKLTPRKLNYECRLRSESAHTKKHSIRRRGKFEFMSGTRHVLIFFYQTIPNN